LHAARSDRNWLERNQRAGGPYRKPKQLTDARESVDSLIDERSLQIDLVRPDRAVPTAGRIGSRKTLSFAISSTCCGANPRKRVALSSIDRLLLVGLYRLAPGVLDALKIIRPETLLRWHRSPPPAFDEKASASNPTSSVPSNSGWPAPATYAPGHRTRWFASEAKLGREHNCSQSHYRHHQAAYTVERREYLCFIGRWNARS